MEFVSSLAGDHGNHSAQRTAEFRLVAARFDLNFIDKFKRSVLSTSANIEVGNVCSIDVIHVFSTRGAVHRETGQQRFISNTGHSRNQGVEVSSPGKNLEHLFGHGHPFGCALDVDEG